MNGRRYGGKMKKYWLKRWMGLVMAALLLTGGVGCGADDAAGGSVKQEGDERRGGEMGEDVTGGLGEMGAGTGGSGNVEKVMGRYVESVNGDMADFALEGSRLVQLEDGRLMMFSPRSGKWVSEDGGESWTPESLAWFSQMRTRNDYIMDIAVSADGYVGIIFCEGKEGSDGQESAGEGAEDGENGTAGTGVGAGNGENGEKGDVVEKSEADGGELRPKYMVYSPDNEGVEFEIPYERNKYLHRLSFSEDGRLFGAAMDGKIYEIDWKQGEQRVAAEADGLVYHMEVWGGRIVCCGGKGIAIFDLDTGEPVADRAIEEFLNTEMKENMVYATAGVLPLLVIPAGEDILYLVCEKGIYRHVFGGNLVEQLADGTLNSLGNPSYGLGDGILMGEDEFLLLFTNGQLGDYSYDPDVPATPDILLRAYSLEESEQLKKVIADFQAKHPEVYVRYDVGLDGNSSATREDALKKLNTEIAAGNGPDLFILDDMPVDSYMEKGVLADLTPYLEAYGEGYFQKILRAFESEGKIQAVPTGFTIPIVGGRAEDVGKMKNLASIAEVVRQRRKEMPTGSILGPVREKDMIKQFLWVCAPSWKKEDGSVEEEKLEEFFAGIQEVWDAEKEGITDTMRKKTDDFYLRQAEQGNSEEALEEFRINHIGWSGDQYMIRGQEFFMGDIDSCGTMDLAMSCFHVKGREDGDFASYGGQVSNVFIPQTIAGISQTSEHREMAAEMVGMLIEESYWSGLNLNKEQLKKDLRTYATEDGSSYASAGGSGEDGTYFSYEIYPASEEEVDRLIQIAEQAEAPYVKDRVLEKAVREAGEKVLKGEMTAKEGAKEVVNRVALYLAE